MQINYNIEVFALDRDIKRVYIPKYSLQLILIVDAPLEDHSQLQWREIVFWTELCCTYEP